MKTLVALLVLLQIIVSTSIAQISGQPDFLGMTYNSNDKTYGYPYATLFESTCRYFLTCYHSVDGNALNDIQNGDIFTFSNGQKARVKKIHFFPNASPDSYDIVIGEFRDPVSGVTPPEVWWQMPQDLKQDEIEITGWSYSDRWFTGSNGLVHHSNLIEKVQGLQYTQPLVHGGYSGAPIFYQGKLLGINWGAWGTTPSGGYAGGWATLLFLVFQDYWSSFPTALISSPPTKTETLVSVSGLVMELTLRTAPGTRHQITTTENLSQWIPVYQKAGFIESVPLSQWETKVKWNILDTPQAFFRAERQ